MNTRYSTTFAAALATSLFLFLSAAAPAGTVTVVNLPATNTDMATGIITNKHYVCAFDYGNQNTTTYYVNGVPFTHFDPGNQTVNVTSVIDPNFGGQVILSSGPSPTNASACKLARTSNATQGSLSSQADGVMRSILTDLIYVGSSAPIGTWLQQEYDNLTIGDPYSLRIYYRDWSTKGDRTQNIFFNGEGTWQPYANNPLDEDAGGAHYLEYDFTAAATNVFCVMTNLVANGSMMIYGATLEDTSTNYPYAPFITYQAKPIVVGNPSEFGVTAIGTAPLSYLWYFNTQSNYSDATLITNGGGYSGASTSNLTATTNLLDYYFVIVSNNYGAVTSAITQLGLPSLVAQPSVAHVGSSFAFSVSAAGLPPLSYQWYFNTVSNYSGATALTNGNGYSGVTTTNLTISTNVLDYYFVVVTNAFGSITSLVAQADQPLTVLSAGEPIWNQAGQTNVILTFSHMVDPVTAGNRGNYSLDNGATILSATLPTNNEVVLTTSALSPGTAYTLTAQNVEDYLGVTMSPASTNIAVGLYPANLALWLKADSGVILDTGTNTVNEWNDLSGNNNNLFGYGPPFDPQIATNAEGDTVIRFTATNETILYAYSSPSLAITGDMSIIAVINFATYLGGTNGMIVSKTASNIPAPYDYYVVNSNTGARFYRGNGSSYGQFTATEVPSLGVPHLLAVTMAGPTVTHFLDGVPDGTGILNNNFATTNIGDTGAPLFIGTREDTANRLTGDISELIIAGSALSSYDLAGMNAYLAQSHNLSLINTSPTNVVFSVTAGQLTLSWPSDHLGWGLQSNSIGLSASNAWFTIPNSTQTNQFTISLNASQTNVYYRMVLP